MAGYSSEEITSAVSKFVKSSTKTKRDPLGPVDMTSAFEEVMELFSSTLLFDPNAIFYLIFLATNKLNVSVVQALVYIDDLKTAVEEVSKRTKAVSNQDLLGDAASALLEVDSLLSTNQTISSPAFNRYTAAIDSFTAKDLSPNIKYEGTIVRPPPLARSDSFDNLRLLDDLYTSIIEGLTQVMKMLSEFNALNLTVLTVQRSVRQARYDLSDLQSYFDSTSNTADEKIAKCREAYLRLTSGKAVLTNLTTITDPSDSRMNSSASVLGRVADAIDPGVNLSASVTCTKSAPWLITTGVNDTLIIQEDGAVSPTTYTLVPPEYPSVDGAMYGTLPGNVFDIGVAEYAELISGNSENFSISAPANWLVLHVVDSSGLSQEFRGQLTAGVYSASALVTEIGLRVKLNGSGASITTATNVHANAGKVHIEHLLSGDDRSITVGQKVDTGGVVIDVNSVLGWTAGAVVSGRYANNGFQLDGGNVEFLPSYFSADTLVLFINGYDHGTYPVGTYEGQKITRTIDGTPREFIRIKKKLPATTLTITAPDGANRDRTLRAMKALGLYEGQSDSSSAMTADEVAEIINAGGKVLATTSTDQYESGETGIITSATTLTVPVGSIDSGAYHVGRQLLLRTGFSAGYHRIVSIVNTLVTTITVESSTPFVYSGTPEGDQSWIICSPQLLITSLSETISSSLVVGSGTANTTLGLSAGTTRGTTTGFKVYDADAGVYKSFVQADVVVKDIVDIHTPVQSTHEVSAVSSDGYQLELSPALPNNLSGMTFEITSAAAVNYGAFVTSILVWENDLLSSSYASGIAELERVMNPVLYNTRPTQAQRADALTALGELETLFGSLNDALVDYVVDPVPRIDAALKMLQERALERAYDLLLAGYVAQFFAMGMDEASRSAYMLKTMRSTVQNDVPLSRMDPYGDDTKFSRSWIGTDPNYDTSDRDMDENVAILGEVAEYPEGDTESYRKML